MKNKPQITLSLTIRQSEQGADPEYVQYRKGYASTGRRGTCTPILQSGGCKFKNPVEVIGKNGS